jgi:membrane-associated phospholipid phosphatase
MDEQNNIFPKNFLVMRINIFVLKPFVYLYIIFLLLSIISLIFIDFDEIHFFIYRQHSEFLDILFKYSTNLGDGLFAIGILVLICCLKPLKYAWLGVLSFAISGILSQFVKKVIAPSALRPIKVYDINKLHLVDGVTVHSIQSFPSGHTATAFALFMFLAFVYHKNKAAQYCFAFTAILVGYSRIYLTQHFLIDVICGSLIGMISFFIANEISEKWPFAWYNFSLKNKLKKINEV